MTVTGSLRDFCSDGGDSTLICSRGAFRGFCLVVAVDVDLTTEFCEVEGARGWETLLLLRVVDVLPVIEAVRFRGFSGTSDTLRFVIVRGAIFTNNAGTARNRAGEGCDATTPSIE